MRRLALITALLACLCLLGVVEGALSDYAYQISVTITNESGAALTNDLVAVPMNADNLVTAGFLQADGDDIQGSTSSGTELEAITQGMTSDNVTWWLEVDSLADNASAQYYYHVGDPDSGAIDQYLVLDSGDSVEVAYNYSLSITDELTVEATVDVASAPSSAEYLIYKPNSYALEVGATNWQATLPSAQDVQNGENAVRALHGVNWESQTFTTTAAYTITGVNFKAKRTGTPGTITASVRATSAGLPTGADLASCTWDGDDMTTATAGAWYGCEFATTTALSNATVYALVIRATAGDGSNSIDWRYYSGAGYANGQRAYSSNSGSSWTADATDDYSFHTFIEYTATHAHTGELATWTTVKMTYASSTLKLYTGGTERASTAVGSYTAWQGQLPVEQTAVAHYRRARIADTDISSPTWVLDLQYEPNQVEETDKGDAGDSWGWEGTIADQSASSNDATYSITRDMSDISVQVGALELKTLATDIQATPAPAGVIGDPGVHGGSAHDSNTWMFRNFFDAAEGDANMNMSTDAFWWIWVMVGTMAAGMATMVLTHRLVDGSGSLLLTGVVMFGVLLICWRMTPLDLWIALICGVTCLVGLPTIGRFAEG